jgi:type IV pilus assembly protein PilE
MRATFSGEPNMTTTRRPTRSHGFTLVEVVVVMAIIGILTAIAIPSYSEYVRRGQRAEARTVLLEAAQFMQRFYSANDRYDQSRAGAAVALPAGMQQVPALGAARYAVSLNAVSTTAYTLQAAPVGGMTADKCGTFTLTSVGRRDVVGASASAEDCWR